MNLTIPIRAKSSTSSWSRGGLGVYLMDALINSRATHRRYVFSMVMAALLGSALVVGSIGGMLRPASARDNSIGQASLQHQADQNNTHTSNNTTNSVINQTQIPSVTPTSLDTAPAIVVMAATQAKRDSQPVAYTSRRMSDETRNRVVILAVVAAVTGGLLYTMSFIGTAIVPNRDIPVRYIVPVGKASTS